ncbi:MAG: PAS domain S-box protein [Smithella sp.]|jgi:diguanylate cyclase (GGDEF)-like protein/PAS domain S-box-containing protein
MTMASKANSAGKPEQKNHSRQNDLSHLANTIISNAAVGIYIVQHGKFVYVSQLYQKLTGYADTELIGTYSLNYIYPDDRDMVRKEAIKCLKKERFEPYEYRFVNKNNEIMVILETITPIVYKGERATLGSFMDITGRKQTERILHENEERLRGITQNLPGIIFQFYAKDNGEFGVSYISEPLAEFSEIVANIDISKLESLFPLFLSSIHEEDRDKCLASIKTAVETETTWNFECRIFTQFGKMIWIQGLSTPTRHKNRLVFNGILLNITDRKRSEEALRESEEKYRELVKYAPAGIYEVEYETGRLKSINDVFCEYTGYTRDELLNMNYYDLLTEESQKYMFERLGKLQAGEKISTTAEYCIRTKSGGELWIRLSVRYLYENGKLKGAAGIVHNITERKRAEDILRKSEQRFRELSIIDDLTQLYNSRHFYAQLEIEIERSNRYAQPLTLLMLDLDNFKEFNDTYGHIEGDYVLSQLGHLVKKCLRETDSAYRYGGEEFTILLPMTTNEEGIITAKRIQDELKKEVFTPLPDKEVFVTMSFGCSQYKPKEDMKAFVHRVDQLMYQAKKNGRNRIFYESQPQEQLIF